MSTSPARRAASSSAARAAGVVGVALLAALLAGCPNLNIVTTKVHIWQAQLIPDPTHADLSGQVAAVAQGAGTNVGIGITGATPGNEHTWGIRLGTCRTPRGLAGRVDDYPTLAVTDSGTAQSESRLGVEFSPDSAYHAELRESVTDSSRIACGNLVLQQQQ